MNTKTFNLLHLSDFHFENGNRDQIIVIKAFHNDLREIVKDCKIDLLVFSGDLVDRGDDNHFQKAYEAIIKPALEICELSNDTFVIVPGNHDVSRKKIKPVIENGFKALSSDKLLNDFIEQSNDDPIYFSRLIDYNYFFNSLNNKNLINKNNLYQSYIFEVNGLKVGVAGLNSTWKSTGEDYGKLLIGERQVDFSIEDLQECDIKIAVLHHSLEWLSEWDRSNVDKRISKEFDIVLSGHNHEQKPKYILDNQGSCFTNQAGCLYVNRKYYNGYSVIKYDEGKKSVEINFRTYFDNRRCFDKGVDVVENGVIDFFFNNEVGLPLKQRSLFIDKYKERYLDEANSSLIISSNPLSNTKDIRKAFVIPLLATEPETASEYNQGDVFGPPKITKVEFRNVAFGAKNYIISGHNESGKSTLLKFVGIEVLEKTGGEIVPVFLNYNKIEVRGANPFYREILNSLSGICKEEEVLDLMKSKRLLVLMDDFEVLNTKKLQKFKAFISSNKSLKYIFSVDENIFNNLKLDKVQIEGVSFEKVFIHTFKISHIKELVNQWFIDESVNSDKVVEKVTTSLIEMGLPFNPTIITFFLYILENSSDINKSNKSLLVQKLIEILLNRLDEDIVSLQGFDLRNKEHVLATISAEFIKRNVSSMKRNELEEFLIKYSKEFSFKFPVSQVVESLIKSGVLNTSDGVISFKLRAFAEYFSAIHMSDNDTWYEYVISESQYYKHKDILDYFTGLKRNDKRIVELLLERMRILYELSDFNSVDLLDISLFNPEFNIFSEFVKRETEDAPKFEITSDQEDDFLSLTPVNRPDQSLEKDSLEDVDNLFSITLDIFSIVIKNSEYISDASLKNVSVEECFNNWSKINLAHLIYIKNNPEDFPITLGGEASNDDENGTASVDHAMSEQKMYSLYVLIQSMLIGNLISIFNSDKLHTFIESVIVDETKPLLVRFNAVCVFAFHQFPNYRRYIESFLRILKSHKFLEDVFIMHLLRIRNESKSQGVKRYIEDIVAEPLVDRSEFSMNRMGPAYKINKQISIDNIKRKLRGMF